MSRPVRKGLDFFPIEVSMFSDLKVRKLIKYQGGQSLSIYTCLLCYIYENGYFVKWDSELPFIISEKTGFEEEYIADVINSCIKVDLFSESLYSNEGVLTSKGIQKRYDFICKQAKRKSNITEFSLIEIDEKNVSQQKVNSESIIVNSEKTIVSSEETKFNSEKTPVNSGKSTQSKVKESKVKKSKENNIGGMSSTPTKSFKLFSETEFYNSLKPFVNEFDKNLIRRFFDYWSEPTANNKMRFQLEKSWETKRRLTTWKNNDAKFGNHQVTDKIPQKEYFGPFSV